MQELDFDKKHIWHPFTQALTASEPLFIKRGKGAFLFDHNNQAYLDLISSWWVTCHGHAHTKIAKSIFKQAQVLEQVIFAGFTHEPAITVCKKLLNHLPKSLSRFFFSDNGSTACEVALKMSFQYFFNQNQKDKKIFLHFEGGYHGDTFGAMSVGKTSSFYKPFEGFLFQTESIPFPHTWDDDPSVLEKEKEALIHLDSVINKHKGQICAFIMEVGVQGASGMKMARPVFFNALCKRLKEAGILIIFDEVMTGFYRTGEMFSASLLDISPDFICLSKALSGGFLPLALTVTTEKIYEAFLSPKEGFAFLHGHSFTASPLGCAAAIASLELFEKPALKKKIKAIEKEHKKGLDELKKTGLIEKSSCQGTIARFELKHQEGRILNELKIRLQKQGFIIRPLKGVIYLMPPYAVLLKDLKKAYMILKQEITNLCFSS